LPQFIVVFAWGRVASGVQQQLQAAASLSPLQQTVAIFSGTSSQLIMPMFLAMLLVILGILALARTSVDYFESRPQGIVQTIMGAMRTLITKGLGAFLLLVFLLPVLTIMPLLRAVALSMLVMLPVTLVAGATGGFKTTWDTLFLRYATQTKYGRWPVFINVLSIAGVFLTALFGISILIESLPTIDTWFEFPAGLLERDLKFFGLEINWGQFLSQITALIWESLALAIIMPFTAALYQLSTVPEEHTPFETEA